MVRQIGRGRARFSESAADTHAAGCSLMRLMVLMLVPLMLLLTEAGGEIRVPSGFMRADKVRLRLFQVLVRFLQLRLDPAQRQVLRLEIFKLRLQLINPCAQAVDFPLGERGALVRPLA